MIVKGTGNTGDVNQMKDIFFLSTQFIYFCSALSKDEVNVVVIAQLVRASDCGSEGRRFEPG